MAGYWMLAVFLLVHLVRCDQNGDVEEDIEIPSEPLWTFKCIPKVGCQRSDSPLPTELSKNETLIFKSLEVCRTVCGQFGGLWPKPVTATLTTETVKIHPKNIRFDLIDAPTETRALLEDMTHVVKTNLFAECGGNVTEFVDTRVVVYITVKTPDVTLSWVTDEQYALEVQTKDKDIAVHIVAETVYGARHALESFSQLIAPDKPDFSNPYHCSLRLVSGAKIRDQPAYRHRGFLLDTSRNFIPMQDIKKIIDGMAATKMNVFHWHVTDSQSFPLESRRVPQFTRYGAYSPNEIYSVEEVRDLIRYAQVRGVRVVIEIDAPAHAGNGWQWGKDFGLGDLAVCVNAKEWRMYCIEPPCGQLNPANPSMYRVLKDLYKDIADLVTKPALLHMGGDEVFLNCWNSSVQILSYMKSKGYERNVEGFIELWAEFHKKALQSWDEALQEMGASDQQPVLLWSSDLTQAKRIQKHLDKDRYVIEVWEPVMSTLLIDLLRLGYRVISVPKDIWYLDHGLWGRTLYSNWRKMYAHTLPEDPNVLGGEVAMWTEYVDAMTFETRIWPRTAAVAERLWSSPNTSADEAEPRLQRLRARFIARGLRVDVLSPAWCAQNDGRCR